MLFERRRPVYYLVLLVGTTVGLTLLYNYGMTAWEGRPQPLYRSFEVVVQSFTTTGYGEDAPWTSPQMNILVIIIQLTGIGLILSAVDVFIVPWLQSALAPTVPDRVTDIEGHIVICSHTPRTEAFIQELESRGHQYVLIESDEDTAEDLSQQDYTVITGNPEKTATLRNAGIESAVALVADASDDISASIVLTARDIDPELRVITLVEDADLRQYHEAAGADTVLSPRQLLGRNLAQEVPTAVTTNVDEGIEVGNDFELIELTITEDSYLSQQTIANTRLREDFGVDIIGVWASGQFNMPVSPESVLQPGMRLLIAGQSHQTEDLRDTVASIVQPFHSQRVIIAGYGDTGKAVYRALNQTNSEMTVIDIEEKKNVDVVGEAQDPAVLEAAGIKDAAVLVLAVTEDTAAILTTLIARDLNPDIQIVVRASQEETVQKLYRAGADYVQSLATISGRMLASTVFEDENVLAYDKQVSIVRRSVGKLAGETLIDANVRATTGCTIVAVVRNGETISDFDTESFAFQPDDEVIIVGSDEAIARFEQQFGT